MYSLDIKDLTLEILHTIETEILQKPSTSQYINSSHDINKLLEVMGKWLHLCLTEPLSVAHRKELKKIGQTLNIHYQTSLADFYSIMEIAYKSFLESQQDLKKLNINKTLVYDNIQALKQNIAHGFFLSSIHEFTEYTQQGLNTNHKALKLHRNWFKNLEKSFSENTSTITLPELAYSLCPFSKWLSTLEGRMMMNSTKNESYDLEGNLLIMHRKLHQEAEYIHCSLNKEYFFEAYNHLNKMKTNFLMLDKYISQVHYDFYQTPFDNFVDFVLSENKPNHALSYYFAVRLHSSRNSDVFYLENQQYLETFKKSLATGFESNNIDSIILEDKQNIHIITDDTHNDPINIIQSALEQVHKHHGKHASKFFCIKTFKLNHLPSCQKEQFKTMVNNLSSHKCQLGISHIEELQLQHLFATATKELHMLETVKKHLEKQDFKVFYQPIVNRQGESQSVEALIRLPQENKLIEAKDFLNMVEIHGLTLEIDMTVFKLLEKDIQQISTVSPALNVNIYPGSLDHDAFVRQIILLNKICKTHNLNLIIELTEHDSVKNKEVLESLNKDHGVRFSIDDFGTGYSNLANLLELSEKGIVQQAKLDGELIANIDTDSSKLAIIKFITDMALNLNLQPVIAEFTDTAEKVALLEKLPSSIIYQGYYFSKAKPIDMLMEENGASSVT